MTAFKAIITALDLIIALAIGVYSIKEASNSVFYVCIVLFFWVIANAAGLWI